MIDTRLPMMIQQPNVLAALDAGTTAAANQNALMRAAEGQNLFRQHGAGAMRGDPQAMNALAGFDPVMAQGMQANQLGMEQTRLGMELTREQIGAVRRQAAEAARAQQDAAAAAAELQQSKGMMRFAGQAFLTGDQASWDMIASEFGVSGIPMNEQGLAFLDAIVSGFEDGLSGLVPEPEAPLSPQGKLAADLAAGRITQQQFDAASTRQPLVEVNTGDAPDARPIAGSPPAGFQRRWDEAAQTWRDEPIPGSAVASEEASGDRTSNLAIAEYNRKAQIVNGNLDRAIEMLERDGRMVAGFGSLLAVIPESRARDFQAMLDTIKANLGFEELQAMRDSSPTGGALGQVTERELAFLQAVQGNLDAAQSPAQLMEILKDIRARRLEFQAERERIMRGGSGGGAAMDFSRMSLQELSAVDLMQVPAEALGAYEAALDRAMGGQQ